MDGYTVKNGSKKWYYKYSGLPYKIKIYFLGEMPWFFRTEPTGNKLNLFTVKGGGEAVKTLSAFRPTTTVEGVLSIMVDLKSHYFI